MNGYIMVAVERTDGSGEAWSKMGSVTIDEFGTLDIIETDGDIFESIPADAWKSFRVTKH